MRKLGLLTLCTLLFCVLFYTLVQSSPTASPAKTTVTVSSPLLADSGYSSSPAPPVSLRMDHTLRQLPDPSTERNFSAPPVPAEHALTPYLNRGAGKQFALLAATLALGLLASRLMRPVTTTPVNQPALREPELERATDQNLEELEHAHTQLREAQLLLDSDTATHADELVAVNGLLDSREVELNEARDRLTMLEQTIAELREELTLTQQRYDALSSTQQDLLERHEHEKHDKLQAYATEIDEYEGEVEALRSQVNQTQQELESKDSLLNEVKHTYEETAASKDELELQLQDARNKLADEAQLVGDLELAKDSLSERVAQLQQQAVLAKNKQEELDLLGQHFEELVTSRDLLVEQYDALDHNFTTAHKRALEADELEDELRNIKEEFERVTTSKDEYVAELGEMHSLFGQAQSRASEADELEDQISQVVTDLESVASARDIAEQQVVTLTASLQEVIEKLGLADSRFNETEQQAQASQTELESVRDELDQRNGVLFETQELFDSKQAALLVLQQNFDSLSREEQELRDEHKELKQQSSRFESENETLTESIDLLREDLAEMVHKVGENNSTISKQQEQLSDESRKVTAQQAEIEVLLGSVETEHEKLNALNVEIEEAKATEQRLLNWDSSLQTYRGDISDKNKLIDQLRDCVSASVKQSTDLEEQSRELELKLEKYETLQSELASTRDEYAGVGETLEQQQRLAEQLSELGKEREEALATQTESLNEIQAERQQWLDQLRLKTNTAAELEAELLDQHDIFLTVEELIDQALSERGVAPGASASFELSADSNQPNSVLVRKGYALIDVLEKADMSNRELATLQGTLENQLEQSTTNIDELKSIHLDQSSKFDDRRKELQEQLKAAANEHQGLLAELEEIREARDLLAAKSQQQEAKTEQLEQEHQRQTDAVHGEQQAHIEQIERQHQSQFESTEKDRNAHLDQLKLEHQLQFESATEQHATELTNATEELVKTAQEHQLELARATEAHTIELEKTTEELAKTAQEHQLELARATEAHTIELEKTTEELAKTAQEHQLELARTTEEHTSELEKATELHASKLEGSIDEHTSELAKTIEDHALELHKQQQQMQENLDSAANDHQELLAEFDEVRQQHETTSAMSIDQATQIGKLTSELDEANIQLGNHTDQFAQYRNSLDTAVQKVTEAEEVWAETDTALQASETALKQKDYELNELRDLLKTVERVGENDRVNLEQTEKELELKRRAADEALEALNAAREESESVDALRSEAITELTRQQNRYGELEQSLNSALHEQRKDNARLRSELAAQKERATHSSPVPVLTQKIKGGTEPAKIPVLGQPLAGGVKMDQSRIPVLKKPFNSDNS